MFPLFMCRERMPQSHQVRRTFDIIKAEQKREAAGSPSYASIATAMGLKSRQAVGHWFRGRGEPNVQQMKQMAQILGCHWLELATEDAVVLYREDEIKRAESLRQLGPEDLDEVDAFIAFKLASKSK